jgi:AGZA family xanthine/uracil permease-like MFS transporter
MPAFGPALDRYFGITEAGSTFRREVVGGVTTFATMSYIIFVQPTILSMAGMPFGSVLLATCLSTAVASILMGVLARYPIGVAPGMGENFLFAFTICGTAAMGGMGFSWRAGLAIVFVAGLLFLLLSLFNARAHFVRILPDCLKNAIGPAIGLFIAFVGFQWGGVVVLDSATMVSLGDLHRGPPLVTLAAVLVIVALMAVKVRGAILAGILLCAGVELLTGVIPFKREPLDLGFQTFFALDFAPLVENWHSALIAIALMFFLDLFDTVGTLVGVGKQAGLVRPDGSLERAGRAFFSDAAGSTVGALFGTSTLTAYIESASGVAAGARTGLAAVITGLCFLGAIFLAPLAQIVGQDIGPTFYANQPGVMVSMYPAVAPALIVIGVLMVRPLQYVRWDDLTEALPAFFTVAIMVFGYGIIEGVAMGCIMFVLVKTMSGRASEVHPAMYIVAALLIGRYAFLV